MLTRQKLGHIATVVAEAKMFGTVFQTPVANAAVSSRKQKGDAASAYRPRTELNIPETRNLVGVADRNTRQEKWDMDFSTHQVVRNCCKPVSHMGWELQGFTEV